MSENKPHIKKEPISSFSVLLIMVTLMVVGLSAFSLVSIQYAPAQKHKNLTISFSWPEASARIIEQEVTSKLEGVLSTVSGVDQMNSASYYAGGDITLSFKAGRNMEAARFEVATLIRQIRESLPEGVSYPSLSASINSTSISPILTYTLNSPLPSNKIEKYARTRIVDQLAQVPGVNNVNLSGTSPFFWEITYNQPLVQSQGISPIEINDAISNFTSLNQVIGTLKEEDGRIIGVKIRGAVTDSISSSMLDNIVLKSSSDRIIRLGDIATSTYKEEKPTSYYRINGLNTINIAIYPETGINTLKVIEEVKAKMTKIEADFGSDFSALIANDSSEYINKELDKIWFRTILSLAILLAFVFLVSRSFRYLAVIFIALLANVLIAFIFYWLFSVELHIYSLAGITVSIGIMIDTSIIMAHHYNFYRNRKVFMAILGALLTTIGSLIMVFFLPENMRDNLVDFSIVIIINLIVSLIVAMLFIPALLEKIPIKIVASKRSRKRLRRISKATHIYRRFICFGQRHKGIAVVSIVLIFGLPVFMLPGPLKENRELRTDFWGGIYNKTFGSELYINNIKPVTDVALGGTLRVFVENLKEHGGYREPGRETLNISASMPEGCSVHQLNEVMKAMENYLSGFDQIDMFTTRIYSASSGMITVTFKRDVEKSSFPYMLKNMAIRKAINYGGATWAVWGIDRNNFHNNVMGGFKSNWISLTGYNYDMLYKFAQTLCDSLSNNRRVAELGIHGSNYENFIRTEYYTELDFEKIAAREIDLGKYFTYLSHQLYNNRGAVLFDANGESYTRLKSSETENFDIWQINNSLTEIDSTQVRLSEFGSIKKRQSGNNIYKKNQEYVLSVGFNFVGTQTLSQRMTRKYIKLFEEEYLPVGYTIKDMNQSGYWNHSDSNQYLVLGLIIVVIYIICAILFESLILPLIIIMMIFVSFIGLFLIFWIGQFTFDQGGYAAFVLLAGISVNAGIYLINEYQLLQKSRIGQSPLTVYLTAYNRKIVPITLTIVSTILGLLPFLYDGVDEVFWFSFAIGSIGGIAFSIVALVIYLPILMPLHKKENKLTP